MYAGFLPLGTYRPVVQPTQVEDLFSRLKEAEESVAKAEGEWSRGIFSQVSWIKKW